MTQEAENGRVALAILERVEQAVERIEQKVDKINNVGCAQRPNDLGRIVKLEEFKDGTTNKFIGSLFTAIGALAVALWNMLTK